MKVSRSRYLIAGESFSEIARRAPGSVLALELELSLEDARQEVSKSLRAAFSRAKRRCCIKSGDGVGPFTVRRAGAVTHLWVTVL